MEIPKMKILIYALSIIGCVWTGQGSGLLTQIRDAIVTVEGFISDYLENGLDIIKKLGEARKLLHSVEDNCIFSCPTGETPVRNKYHKPSYNGCGTDLLKLKISEYVPGNYMTECCNQHDLCYDTCNNPKDRCDEEFKHCLYKICNKVGTVDTLIKACKVAASTISGTLNLGCKPYLESQQRSCYCPGDNKKRKYAAGDEL